MLAFVAAGVVLPSARLVFKRTRFDPSLPSLAQAALDDARRAPSANWAEDELRFAQEAYRSGMAALVAQRARLWILRDMRPASHTLALAVERAREAGRAGGRRMEEKRGEVESILRELAETMETLDELEVAARLPRGLRADLSSARMGFVEASALAEAGEFGGAQAKAQAVLTKARRVMEGLGDAFFRFADEERIRTWGLWISETIAWSREHNAVALVVVKEKNVLDVYRNGRRVASFPADLGSNNLAQKYRQGDRATPEGRYKIAQLKDRGQSRYYRALLLDYPTAEDLRRIEAAREAGVVPPGSAPGALIEIHGEGGRGDDWTNGCVALTNEQMDRLFEWVRIGAPVTIVGGDGSAGPYSSMAGRLRDGR